MNRRVEAFGGSPAREWKMHGGEIADEKRASMENWVAAQSRKTSEKRRNKNMEEKGRRSIVDRERNKSRSSKNGMPKNDAPVRNSISVSVAHVFRLTLWVAHLFEILFVHGAHLILWAWKSSRFYAKI